ncbi:chondroitinase-B domain-containing protein [Sphingobacterium sp. WOUb80]|uniref:chondroitinase-B domain-containing protein n=1 Tax=Sphingobacterium sp. WOUb80 TaxID=3234028 RepID=UPI003CF9FAED
MKKLSMFGLFLFIIPFLCVGQLKNNQEINRIINNLPSGETFYLPNGEYKDLQIQITSKNRISIKAQQNGKVRFSGNSFITIRNSNDVLISGFLFDKTNALISITLQNSNRVTVSDNYFDQCGNGEYNSIIMIKDGSSNNIITRNTFNKNRTMGVRINDFNNFNNEISFNSFLDIPRATDIYRSSGGNGLECIMVGSGKQWKWNSNTIIRNNYFKNVIGDATEIISLKSNKNSVLGNYFENSKGGISLRLGNNSIISKNTFFNTAYPVRVYGAGHKIIGNTMNGGVIGIQLPGGDSEQGSNQRLASYFRSDNISIEGNFVSNFKESVVMGRTGGKNRNLMPTNITVDNNTFDKQTWLVTDNNRINGMKANGNRASSLDSKVMKMSMDKTGVSWKIQ